MYEIVVECHLFDQAHIFFQMELSRISFQHDSNIEHAYTIILKAFGNSLSEASQVAI